MKNFFLTLTLYLISQFIGFAQEASPSDFITTWKTDNPGSSSNNQIQIPIGGRRYDIYWWLKSDSTNINGSTVGLGSNFILTLPQAGIYGVSISKSTESYRIYFYTNGDKLKLLEINQWGEHQWRNLQSAFYGCENLIITAKDIPNLTQVSNLNNMFAGCSKIEQIPNLLNWDISNITGMYSMFEGATLFNQPLNDWDVSSVTNMASMFREASNFNQPLDKWDVSNVTNMLGMFYGATLFNQPLNGWDVSNVTHMGTMFMKASNFNQPLDEWDVSSVTDMALMFCDATLFNQQLNTWDVSNVTDMRSMFNNASSFNQPLNNWDVSNVTSMSRMFSKASNFDRPINDWDVSNVTDMYYMFNGATSFNQPLNDWNVSNVTSMNSMFYEASNFDRPLNEWNVSNVTDMYYMFNGATSFNQPLNDWNVSNVTNMGSMFRRASSFNQPLNNWDVSNVTNMSSMFQTATLFNQPLTTWNLNRVTNMNNMFDFSAIDCAHTTYTLQAWAVNPNTPSDIILGAQNVNYAPQTLDALNTLRNDKNWTITIGPEVNCEQLPVSLIQFSVHIKEQIVQLDWATALEEDHDFFEVQRSPDATTWTTLAQLKGAGNTSITQNYYTTDPNPLSGTSYYRLKMVDQDGSFDYSPIRSIIMDKLMESRFVYPNPANNTITFQGLPEGMVHFYNTSGQLVKQIYMTPQKATCSINDLPAGTYTLRTQQGWNSSFIKIN